jgi:hypothetical protein
MTYEGVSKIFRTGAVKIINLTTKRVWKLPTSTQLCATWHTDLLDMVVLPSTGASRYHNCCIDGGISPEYFGYTLVYMYMHTYVRTSVHAYIIAEGRYAVCHEISKALAMSPYAKVWETQDICNIRLPCNKRRQNEIIVYLCPFLRHWTQLVHYSKVSEHCRCFRWNSQR